MKDTGNFEKGMKDPCNLKRGVRDLVSFSRVIKDPGNLKRGMRDLDNYKRRNGDQNTVMKIMSGPSNFYRLLESQGHLNIQKKDPDHFTGLKRDPDRSERFEEDPDPLIRGIQVTVDQVGLTGFQPARARTAGGDTDHPRHVTRVKKYLFDNNYGRFAFYSYPPVVFQKPILKSSVGPKEDSRVLKLPIQYSLARLM